MIGDLSQDWREVFATGKFHNMACRGFQEGYYATSSEMEEMLGACGVHRKEVGYKAVDK